MHRFFVFVVIALAMGCAHHAPDTTQQSAQRSLRLIAAEQKWFSARWLARDAVLSDLRAPHRALLGKLIGDLAVAPDPDVGNAMRILDATLDSNEKSSITWAGRSLQKSWKPLWVLEKEEMVEKNPSLRFGRSSLSPDPGAALLDLTMNSAAYHTAVAIRRNPRAQRDKPRSP